MKQKLQLCYSMVQKYEDLIIWGVLYIYTFMHVLGDVGRFPMYIYSAKRCIKYWIRLLTLPRNRYIKLCYEMLMCNDNLSHTNWVTDVQWYLYTNVFWYVWERQKVNNPRLFLIQIEQRLKDQYVQNWRIKCNENIKLCHYVFFKHSYNVEKHVTAVDISKFRSCMANFRSSEHNLTVEKSRHIDLNREFRDCIHCTAVLEDEFHFVLICPLYSNIRSLYIPKYFVKNTTLHKFYGLICRQKVIKLLEI